MAVNIVYFGKDIPYIKTSESLFLTVCRTQEVYFRRIVEKILIEEDFFGTQNLEDTGELFQGITVIDIDMEQGEILLEHGNRVHRLNLRDDVLDFYKTDILATLKDGKRGEDTSGERSKDASLFKKADVVHLGMDVPDIKTSKSLFLTVCGTQEVYFRRMIEKILIEKDFLGIHNIENIRKFFQDTIVIHIDIVQRKILLEHGKRVYRINLKDDVLNACGANILTIRLKTFMALSGKYGKRQENAPGKIIKDTGSLRIVASGKSNGKPTGELYRLPNGFPEILIS